MAYPAFIEDGGLTFTSAKTIPALFPDTVNANDFLLLFYSKDIVINADIDVHPSGFTFITNTSTGSNSFATVWYYKRAIGNEAGPGNSVSLTWDEVPDSVTSAIMYRFNKVATTSTPPIDFAWQSSSGASTTTSANIDGGTTVGTERLLVNVIMVMNNTTVSTASGWTTEVDLPESITTVLQTQQVPTATTISDQTSTLGTASYYIASTMALILGPGWPHNFLGVENASINEISEVSIADIEAVNTIT